MSRLIPLNANPPTPYAEDIPPTPRPERGCLTGTREYILTSIRSWGTDPKSSKTLWLTDISGSGKSATARQVAMETSRCGQLLCSFFFRRDIAAQSNVSLVACNLSSQLARLGGPIASTIQAARERMNRASGTSFADSFHELVTLPLCSHPPERYSLILIDALDESGTSAQRAEFLSTIAREVPLLPATVKVLLTSKPEQDIEQALDRLGTEATEGLDIDGYRRLTFDVYGENNRQDLRRFIQHAFQQVAESKRPSAGVPESWPSFTQRRGLVTRANGLFLWAKVAADHIAYSTDPEAALKGILELTTRPSPEAAMEGLYGHILDSVSTPSFDYKVYHEVMKQVLTSSTPMTIGSISQNVGYDVSSIIKLLQALLPCDPVVRVVHQSFREYVQNNKKCESRFHPQEPQSASTSPLHPELHLRFPLHRLATIKDYPYAQHLAPDVGSQIDPNSISDTPIARGGSGDIYRARYTDGLEVAIKSIRAYGAPDEPHSRDLERKSVRELEVWSKVNHPNVLGLLGICVLSGEIAMVSEWMPNNNVREYARKHPHVNKLGLIADIAAGLEYLHREGIIHGDLKGANVVVSVAGTCRLVDFGLAKLSNGYLGITTTSSIGTFRWMSPELMDTDENKKPVVTNPSDIWALGMTFLEVLTGQVPFAEYPGHFTVFAAIKEGKLPKCLSLKGALDLTDPYRELLMDCLSAHPTNRPSAAQVVERLRLPRAPNSDSFANVV